MKNYTITVNGNVYDVVVEEKGAGTAPAAPVTAPAARAGTGSARGGSDTAPAAPAAAPAGAQGSVRVEAGAAGKVYKIDAPVGQAVKAGDAVVTIEAMKMEIPVVAPKDGTVASINVSVGDAIEAGALLATLN